MASQGPGDEDLAAVTTEEPLTAAGADALGSTPPEGPPLPLPSVAPERGTPPVSEDFTSHRVVKICLGQSYRGGKERPELWEGPGFSSWSATCRIGAFERTHEEAAVCRDKARGKNLGPLALCPKLPTSLIEVSLTGRPAERYKGPSQKS